MIQEIVEKDWKVEEMGARRVEITVLSRAARKTPTYKGVRRGFLRASCVEGTQIEPRMVKSLRVERSSGSESSGGAPASMDSFEFCCEEAGRSGSVSLGSEWGVAVAMIRRSGGVWQMSWWRFHRESVLSSRLLDLEVRPCRPQMAGALES